MRFLLLYVQQLMVDGDRWHFPYRAAGREKDPHLV